ncbi:hypothetical protein ASG90_04895 [Nocardioides sp. Soil797]|nr:hypothetical protein ASG90_04895 [Nocardioides sp. Soil797]
MTFDLLPNAALLAASFFALATVAGIVAIGALTAFFVTNHEVRVTRRQSIPTYYRQLAFSH